MKWHPTQEIWEYNITKSNEDFNFLVFLVCCFLFCFLIILFVVWMFHIWHSIHSSGIISTESTWKRRVSVEVACYICIALVMTWITSRARRRIHLILTGKLHIQVFQVHVWMTFFYGFYFSNRSFQKFSNIHSRESQGGTSKPKYPLWAFLFHQKTKMHMHFNSLQNSENLALCPLIVWLMSRPGL